MMYRDEEILEHALAAISQLGSRFPHETGIFSTMPSSHTIVRNLIKRMAEGKCFYDPLCFEPAVGGLPSGCLSRTSCWLTISILF